MGRSLYYTKPAEDFSEALPIGCGRLGAMVYGGIRREKLTLNEDSVWQGRRRNRVNPDAADNLGEIRRLLLAGQIAEAEKLSTECLAGTPPYMARYQTLGTLTLDYSFDGDARVFPVIPWEAEDPAVSGYKRSLDLGSAVAETSFVLCGTVYTRQAFASYPDGCIFLHLLAEGPNRQHFCTRLERPDADREGHLGDRTLMMEGDTGGIRYAAGLRVFSCDGKVSANGGFLEVEDAGEVWLALACATTYRAEDPEREMLALLDAAERRGGRACLERHLLDYRSLFERSSISIGEGSGRQDLPTDERIDAFREDPAADPDLVSLYYDYGRYLMIASSRLGSLPANLQGIWNEDMTPPWDSKYTININLQMNYWPVDRVNLCECADPFFDLLEKTAESGRVTAKEMYGCRGFVAHHNTDLYGDSAPQEQYIPASFWPLGGAWLATHIREHYRYTGDRAFLERLFPVLQDAVLFLEDFLAEDEDGFPAVIPSCSPENVYALPNGEKGCLTAGNAMDSAILRELFSGYLEACTVLDVRNEVQEKACALLPKFRREMTGSDGRLLEWRPGVMETEPGHRHISHLYGLFPGNTIDPMNTPELALAARKTLDFRLANGGGHTGWSRAWITLFFARLLDGEKAFENLALLIGSSSFPNLMDFHPLAGYKKGAVFQIDGNFGGITAIAEMLAGNYGGKTVLLPALPKAWPEGRMEGLKLPGGAVLSLSWKDGRPAEVRIRAEASTEDASTEEGADYFLSWHAWEERGHLQPGQSRCFAGEQIIATENGCIAGS